MSQRRRLLAESSFCRVERHCGCGRVLEVHLGALTLRFDPGSLRALQRTLSDALDALDREVEEGALLLDVQHAPPRGQA